MSNSLSHSLPYPIRNARFTLALSFRVAAGTPTDPTTPDTEFSTDGGVTFVDCAEEITTGGGNGQGYLTLTGAETNADVVGIAAKSANCLTTPASLYPRMLATVGTGTLSAGSAGGGTLGTLLAYDVTGCFIQTTGGTGGGGAGGANNQARKIVTYNTGTGAFTVAKNWETTPSTDTTYNVLLPEGVTLGMLKALNPTTPGRTLVVDAAGLGDANTVKLGPSGSGVAQTGLDLAANWTAARAAHLDADISSRMATFTLPTNFSSLGIGSGGHITNVDTVTTLTNLPAITANWLTATGIAASAINGKGDWNIGKTGYSLTSAYDPAKTASQAGDAMTLTSAYDAAKTAAQAGNAMTLTTAYDNAKLPNLQPGGSQTGIMQCTATTGQTYDFYAYDGTSPPKVWNGASWEVMNPLSYSSYRVAATEQATGQSGRYYANAPDAATVSWELRVRGGSMAASTVVSTGSFLPAQTKSDTSSIAPLVTTVGTPVTSIAGDIAAAKTVADGIAAKTTNLPSSPAAVGSLMGLADGAITAAKFATDAIAAAAVKADAVTKIQAGLAVPGSAMTLTSGERDSIAAALLDLSNGVETSLTPRQALKLMAAIAAGQISGAATTTIVIKAANNSSTTRITASVDSDGNRSALTLNI